jgi:hypothetical protein
MRKLICTYGVAMKENSDKLSIVFSDLPLQKAPSSLISLF